MGCGLMADEPYMLAIASHKGGTGRTTTALALAWQWGGAGLRVTVADADPVHDAGLIALDRSDGCPWPYVHYISDLPESGDLDLDADVVIIDCPPLMSAEAPAVLARADGVVLTCQADPLSLRTVPAAAGVLATARIHNPKLELLGVLIGGYNAEDPVQTAMLGRLRQMHGELLLEPPIPEDAAIREWALTPGAGLPVGRAADAYSAVARQLRDMVRRLSGVALAARRGAR
jgi:cellulose biosynthesis protein BcsQ